jgi:hypothetical protein
MGKDEVVGLVWRYKQLESAGVELSREDGAGMVEGANVCRGRQPLRSALRPERCGAGESSQRYWGWRWDMLADSIDLAAQGQLLPGMAA